jgi:lysophospholipid acyltransferase (LPLAT)-like uncharacterized protein
MKKGMIYEAWLKIKRYLLPYPMAYCYKALMKLILITCKWQIDGLDNFVHIASKGKCILVLWHNRVAILPDFLDSRTPQFNYAALISNSRDGAPLAILTNSYKGGNALRVSHHLRHEALKSAIQKLKSSKDIVIFTPDGPRGQRYRIKHGIVHAAKEVGANVVPFTWESKSYWQLKTWDQFRIPKPFTTIKVTFGNPISSGLDKINSLEKGAEEIEKALFALSSEAASEKY